MYRERKRRRIVRPVVRKAPLAGFTLIELMIVVAAIAILAGIALPSYQESVRKARRADAKGALTYVAQLMERRNTERNSYASATLGTAATDLYPAITENKHYTLALSNLTATTFTITATPSSAQSADPCGAYTLTHAGVRGAALAVDQCW
jgi:type IV pilus assembly protein PilE